MRINRNISLLIVIAVTVVIGCSTSEPTTNGSNTGTETDNKSITNTQTNENVSKLMISNLSDTYSSNTNTIPPEFSEIKKEVKEDIDLTKGFRIQIYSGQDVFEADTIASRFRAWSDTTIVGYQAETYTFFKTPYYRVHIGDFHDRERAFLFSKMVKRLFRDAWVVYDTVNPYLVPEDTTQIKFQ
tara:strand:- start:3182 stop:3736 length:555 start_codon:yes stop_codon:yes gene_type:complete